MKNLIITLVLVILSGCGTTLQLVVDAEGDGSFHFRDATKMIGISGDVHGQVDSLTAFFKIGKAESADVNEWLANLNETRLRSGSQGSISGLFRAYINGAQVAHIPFSTQSKTANPLLSLSKNNPAAPPTYRGVRQVQTWGMTGIGFAYGVGISYTNTAGQLVDLELDSGGCLWHTTASDIPDAIPNGTTFTVWIDPHGCVNNKTYSVEVMQVDHGANTAVYFNVWGNCFTQGRLGQATYPAPQ